MLITVNQVHDFSIINDNQEHLNDTNKSLIKFLDKQETFKPTPSNLNQAKSGLQTY